MKREFSAKRELLAVLISFAVAVAVGIDMYGEPARVVHLLTLAAASVSAGVGLGRWIERRRQLKTEQPPIEATKSVPTQ